jgi:glycosyltransferase involved in cell wall biosynthesis
MVVTSEKGSRDRIPNMKVSVCMITYNHAKFIAQAIESVMMQETDFDYELVIGEDCSTDRTRERCTEYQKKYTDRIRLLLRERNLGMMHNFAQTFYACAGQYVALLDGDDYWTLPHKLHRQAEFLDTHPDYAMCFTRTLIVFEGNSREPKYGPHLEYRKDTSTIEDLLRGDNFINTCSVMFRNHLFDHFPDWFFSLEAGDYPLNIMNAQHGKIGYIDEAMAAYRIHSKGVYQGSTPIEKLLRSVKIYKAINMHLNFKYQVIIGEILARTYQDICRYCVATNDMKGARAYGVKSIKSLPLRAYFSKSSVILFSLVFKAMVYVTFPRSLVILLRRIRQRLVVRL